MDAVRFRRDHHGARFRLPCAFMLHGTRPFAISPLSMGAFMPAVSLKPNEIIDSGRYPTDMPIGDLFDPSDRPC
jgi:hypothetical protein